MSRSVFYTSLAIVLVLIGAGVAQAQPEEGLYGISVHEDKLFFVDVDTGQVTEIGELGITIDTLGIDFACDGTLWGFSKTQKDPMQHSLYTVDLMTGNATVVQIFDTSDYDHSGVGFEFGADEGTFYWRNNMDFHVLDVGAGTITKVADFPGDANSLTVNPDCSGTFLSVEKGGMMVSVDEHGNRVEIGQTGLIDLPRVTSLASVPDGRVFGHRKGLLHEFDPTTGGQTVLFDLGQRIAGLAWGPTEVTCAVCPFDCPPTLDFETDPSGAALTPGQVIDDEFVAFGITVTTNNPSSHPAMIFDSGDPTCNDSDLGTPNKGFDASFPGIGSGGAPQEPGRNALPRGNVLILSEGTSCIPDDLAGGGTFIFTFDPPVPLVTEVHILDVEASEGGLPPAFGTPAALQTQTPDDGPRGGIRCSCTAEVTAFDEAGAELVNRRIFGFGNNSFQVVPVGAKDVGRLEVKLCGSGALSAVVFCRDCGANFGEDQPDRSPLRAELSELCLNCSRGVEQP